MGQKLSKPEQAAFDTVVEKRADAFSASTDVAAAIPTHTLEQVISKARTMGGLMAEARAFSMPSKSLFRSAPPALRRRGIPRAQPLQPKKSLFPA